MRIIFLMVVVLVLSGCDNTKNISESSTLPKSICLDGVAYWGTTGSGKYNYLAPRYSARTGEIRRCSTGGLLPE